MSPTYDRRTFLALSATAAALPLVGCAPIGAGRSYTALSLRPEEERGRGSRSWLEARYSFSFSRYQDPAHMGFRALRVMNEDRIAGGGGFPMHGHEDMEIVTWVLDGALEHKDSLGNGGVIQPGLAQRMSAGTGIRHSEFNPSQDAQTHLLQIWLHPDQRGHTPGYDQRQYSREDRTDRLRVIASGDGRDGSIAIHQDARILTSLVSPGKRVEHEVLAGRHVWLQVARGSVQANGIDLKPGDGAFSSDPGWLSVKATSDAEILVFDLA